MAGTSGTKDISKRYPVTSGLTAKTTKQTGRRMALIPERKTKVLRKDASGIY
jgi:3-deoxy-D-manno-octulosonate 8-phosphate phosphatase KdsC-like HAD superfamily phosphatase